MIQPFPPACASRRSTADGATIHTRVGRQGSPAVVMLHGFADTGDMWAPLAAALVGKHTVVVPDLRGMGLSSHPAGGYDKKTQAQRHRPRARQARHRQGRARHPRHRQHGGLRLRRAVSRRGSTRWVAMDAPLPGIGPWDEILKSPMLWHFNFRGPDMERLVAGPRAHLSRPLLERAVGQSQSDRRGDARSLRRLYARPGDMHSAFEQFAAFTQDAVDNKALRRQGQARHAGAGDRRRQVVRHRPGRRAALRRQRRHRPGASPTPATG